MAKAADEDGKLFLVATPIGNLQDISLRALQVLEQAALIAAEDTRHTRKLLSAHEIDQAELISYREQNHNWAAQRLLEHLAQGHDVALVSDAGTPAISDPGQALVAEVVAGGYVVVPVPGACAALAALAASGLATDRFLFVGFPPRKTGALSALAESLVDEPGTLVFYESPKRVAKTLSTLHSVLGDRAAVVARELTKVHETFERGSLTQLAQVFASGTRGEVVLLVAGGDSDSVELHGELTPLVRALRSSGSLSAKDVAALLAPLSGKARREIYQLASGLGQEED